MIRCRLFGHKWLATINVVRLHGRAYNVKEQTDYCTRCGAPR